jgi:hypothetical protein
MEATPSRYIGDIAMSETVLIAKMIGQEMWVEVANPKFKDPHPEFLADQLLKISASEYVEYCIAGAVYRVVRRHVLPAYDIDPSPDIPF